MEATMLDGGFPHGFHMIFPFESNETVAKPGSDGR